MLVTVICKGEIHKIDDTLIVEEEPIFIVKDGILKGMVYSPNTNGMLWYNRITGTFQSNARSFVTRRTALETGIQLGYQYVIFKENWP